MALSIVPYQTHLTALCHKGSQELIQRLTAARCITSMSAAAVERPQLVQFVGVSIHNLQEVGATGGHEAVAGATS